MLLRKGKLLPLWISYPLLILQKNKKEEEEEANSPRFSSLLKSGKHHKRKRKHADVVQLTQLKKRSERSTTSYSLRHFPPQVPTLTNDYDPKLSELKEAPTNTGVQLDNLAIHFQQPIPSRGAKRRKSASSVKRFKRDTDAAALQPISAPINMPDANTACNIVKIIKPIGYSASLSDNMHDVLVTFMAMRFVTQPTTPNFVLPLAHLHLSDFSFSFYNCICFLYE